MSKKAAGKCKSRVRNLLSGSTNLTMEKSRVVEPVGWEARELIEHSRAAQTEMWTGAEKPLASMEPSHPGLPEDGHRSYTMSRDMNRCPPSRLGGVTNKKGKSEWKENCISSPPCGTWLFQHIWFVTFADCLVVIKEIRVDERVQLSPSFRRLHGHPPDN